MLFTYLIITYDISGNVLCPLGITDFQGLYGLTRILISVFFEIVFNA